jgi:hypothetical protein
MLGATQLESPARSPPRAERETMVGTLWIAEPKTIFELDGGARGRIELSHSPGGQSTRQVDHHHRGGFSLDGTP